METKSSSPYPKNRFSSPYSSQKGGEGSQILPNRRSNRATKKIVDEAYCSTLRCHHCEKPFSCRDLYQCPTPDCEESFCFQCSRKYNIFLKRKAFELKRTKQSEPCMVCQEKCLCRQCEIKAITDDLEKMDTLIKNKPSQNAVKAKKNEYTPELCTKNQENMPALSMNHLKLATKNTPETHSTPLQMLPTLPSISYSMFDLACAHQQKKKRDLKELFKEQMDNSLTHPTKAVMPEQQNF
ncbi:unnamed protein product [Moneuplotes crassus]|uniref:Uncharacterized protein n=1 Tax=Euplotes crassus TaxID=5936 RepID=A0AAD1XM76_EUPCR|nr:unnamed protein product [Moneuplotes crassus]